MAEFLKTDERRIAKSMIVKKSDAGYMFVVLPGNMRIDFLSTKLQGYVEESWSS